EVHPRRTRHAPPRSARAAAPKRRGAAGMDGREDHRKRPRDGEREEEIADHEDREQADDQEARGEGNLDPPVREALPHDRGREVSRTRPTSISTSLSGSKGLVRW